MVRDRSHSVLVVDDDEGTATMCAHALRAAGFSVTTATEGKEALRAVTQRLPDALVLDMAMPEASGLRVLTGLRELPGGAKVQVIAATAVSKSDPLWKGVKHDWNAYLEKPVDPATLIKTINKLLAKTK